LRWQDYLWLLLLSGSYLLYFLFNRKRRRRKKPRQWVDRPLTRREQKAWHKLQAGGYRLTEIHPALPVTMTVDGKKRVLFMKEILSSPGAAKVFWLK